MGSSLFIEQNLKISENSLKCFQNIFCNCLIFRTNLMNIKKVGKNLAKETLQINKTCKTHHSQLHPQLILHSNLFPIYSISSSIFSSTQQTQTHIAILFQIRLKFVDCFYIEHKI